MKEYTSGLGYDTDSRSGYEYTTAQSSLRRFKRTAEYRALLQKTVQAAGTEERGAKTQVAKARVRLRKFEAETELADLQAGGAPSPFHGLIAIYQRW